MVDEMLDDMADHDTVDAIGALAFPLPSLVISELVGVPIEDRAWLREPISKLVVTLEPSLTDAQYEAAAAAAPGVYDYFVELVAKRRAQPTEDLISALIAARDGHDRLTEGELLSTVMLLFAAGFETTTNLIGNGLLALLRHPDQLRLLCADPSSIPTAVEEILRYDSPVQLDARTAFEAVELADGHVVEPGDLLVTLLGAANRDPAKIAEPERFDVTRDEVPLISFATGIHYCLGASLARLEGAVVLERLLARFPNLELAESDPPWLERLTLRGLERLSVSIGAVA
jgi:cytochrome P450